MMSKFLAVLAVVAAATAEAPGGYNYNAPAVQANTFASGPSFSGASSYQAPASGYSSGGSSGFGGSAGYSTGFGGGLSASQLVDGQLLNQIQQIIYQDEVRAQQSIAPSAAYGAPATYSQKVVGVALDQAQPSVEVSQYSQSVAVPASSFGGSGYSSYVRQAPAAQQYSAPAAQHYSAPAAQHYSAPAAQSYSAPAAQHYSAPAAQHYSAPAAQHYSAPARSAPSTSYGAPY